MRKQLATAAVAALLIAGAATAQEELRPILEEGGTWHGVGVQAGDLHWPLEVTLSDGESALSYPSFGCEGTWTPLRIAGGTLLAIETIQEGRETCSSGGVIRLEMIDDSRLGYSWFDADGDPAARAVLVRGAFDDARYEALLELTMTTLDMGFLSREAPPAPTPEL